MVACSLPLDWHSLDALGFIRVELGQQHRGGGYVRGPERQQFVLKHAQLLREKQADKCASQATSTALCC